jgi:hypothetical protein
MRKLFAKLLRLLATQPLMLRREPDRVCRPQCHVQFLPNGRLKARASAR